MTREEYYVSRFMDIVSSIKNNSWSEGYEKAKKEYGEHSRGVAHCKKATREEIEMYGPELHGWCDCGRPLEGRWVGMARFCQWCGRAIEWSSEEILK